MRSPSIPNQPPAANPVQSASFDTQRQSLINPAARTPFITPLTGVASVVGQVRRGERPSLLGSTQ